MLRTSSYTIYVDLPDHQDEMLLVHGYTGAHDKVSRMVADYLRAHEVRRAPKPLYGEWSTEAATADGGGGEAPSPAVLETLRQRGYLTPLSFEDEKDFFGRLATRLHERASRSAPSFLFMPTYDCNLRCSYCFQDHLRTDGSFKHLLRSMRPQMIERLFAAIPKIEARHGVAEGARRDVGFFGGEPLLAANRPIVEAIMEKAGPHADFWAVTNGTEIDAYRDLLVPGRLDRLQITLDGPPREHDRRRIRADGSGTFARIAANVTMALELGTRISIRLNVDRNNLGDLPAVADEMVTRGWHRFDNFSSYTAPISPANDKTDKQTTLNSWELDQALTEMRAEHPNLRLLGRPDESLRARARRIFGGGDEVLPQLKPSFCAAHSQMYIFDPFGDIYACWERTGDARIRIGHVAPDGEVELKIDQHREWRSRTVASNPVCQQCRYALHCGGGCAILALGQRGKFHANYCDGFASRFRASVADAYLAHVAGAAPERRHERVCDL
jgi:uncharacterized protein